MLPLKYILFAVFATGVNLLFQAASFEAYSGYLSLYVAMFVGTLAGLVTKYILDKKYIFYYETKSRKDDGAKFLFYTFFGVFTTLIFWGTEMVFYYSFESENAKYIGAVLGLSVGYCLKYRLDKRWVFVS